MRRSRANLGGWVGRSLGLAVLLGFALQWIRRARLAADRAASSLEFASSAVIISEKLAQLKDWLSKYPVSIFLVALLLSALVLLARFEKAGTAIADEVEHFERILQFCRKCRRGTAIHIYVRIRQVGRELLLPSESYFRRMEQLVADKGLEVLYIFGISPGDLKTISLESLRVFFARYQRFSDVRVVLITDNVTLRYRLLDLDKVTVLLGERSGLQHQRDSNGIYRRGRGLQGEALHTVQRRYERYLYASMSVEEFLHLPFDDTAPTTAGAA